MDLIEKLLQFNDMTLLDPKIPVFDNDKQCRFKTGCAYGKCMHVNCN